MTLQDLPTIDGGSPRSWASTYAVGDRQRPSLAMSLASWLVRARRAASHPLHVARRSAVVRRALRQMDIPLFRRIEGISFPICMRLGPNFSMWLRGRVSEAAELELFGRLADAINATRFVDVGANVGLYSFHFAARRPAGQVVALEPDPSNMACLEHTVRRAGLPTVSPRAVAAGDRRGRALFQFDDVAGVTGQLKSSNDAFVQRHYGFAPREGWVEVEPLDDLVGELQPDIVKIDVEGAEFSVLRGATRLLRDTRPCLLIELGDGREDCVRLLRELGYTLHDARTLGPMRAETWNALALPLEKAPAILPRLLAAGDRQPALTAWTDALRPAAPATP